MPIEDCYRGPHLASARSAWDARKLPFLWFYGEFGATNQAPFRGVFYTLALQPFSRNPHSRNSLAA